MHNSAPILIIHQGALGDLILSLPALYSLRLFYGQAPWTMAGNVETLSLLHRRFYAQEIVSIHQKEWAYLFQEETSVPDQFRRYLSSFQKAFIFSVRKPQILIQGLFRLGLLSVSWIPSLPDVRGNLSLQSRQQKTLAQMGIPWAESEKTIFPALEDLRKAREYLSLNPRIEEKLPLWAIHPGSGSSHKNWPVGRFIEVAQELQSQKQVQPIFLIGPVEQESPQGIAKTIEARDFPVIRDLSLPILAGVLSHCSGYLGNDSGISHLAAALGIATVILFGPSDPSLWGPEGKTVRILSPSILCAPCSREIMQLCPQKECLLSLTVEQVLGAIGSKINGHSW